MDWLLDKSVYFSFDSSGFARHAKAFKTINDSIFKDKNILITGGTSGIGEALAIRLCDTGANVQVSGRNADKFKYSPLNERASFLKMDMCDFEGLQQFAQNSLTYDYLVCNAGGMPEKLHIINDRYDSIFASQVVGHIRLIQYLNKYKKLSDKCCIHFNSSGGMYLVKLNLDDLKWESSSYDKVASYANAKRAQVILTQELPSIYQDYIFSCSHPGWVGTDAVKESIPGFYKFTKNRLRTSEQGADTIYWCLSQRENIKNGGFYFDRKLKDPYPFFWTKESKEQREKLLELVSL
tara:strand:- start:70157 stop:71038 length:882 start_codon:yes stop_codon:yes gene_type:complete